MHFYVILKSLPISDDRGPSSFEGTSTVLRLKFMYVSSFDSINIRTHRITTTTPLALCTIKMATLKTFVFLLLLQKLTQSMHLDNKLDWVNQHSFQGIHFDFLLGFIFVYFKHQVFRTFIIMPLKHGPIGPNIMLCGQVAPSCP